MKKEQLAIIAIVLNGKYINIFPILIIFLHHLTSFLAHSIMIAPPYI
jgi:hypothetical protein